MESEIKYDTFGSYLRDFRLKRELAIKTVAIQTKITVDCLVAMEENAHDRLPPRAYVKSFIRTYADTVGANADVAMNLYLSDLELQATTRQQLLKRRAKLWAIRRILMAAVAIAGILLLVRYTNIFFDATAPPDTAVPDRSVLPALSTADSRSDGRPASEKEAGDKLKLRVVAVEKTWLKIIVDGQSARSYDLKPEDRLELEGNHNFNLMIGDANGLQIFLDEQPVKIFGRSGQVVSLKIP